MTTTMTPESIKEYFEKASKAYADGWKAQADYLDSLVRRNAKCFTELADTRLATFREMGEAKTFNQAFESNLAFEEKVREELAGLQEANVKSWQTLVENLKSIYTPAEEAPKAKTAPKKAKAAAPKKARAKTSTARRKKAA